MSGTNKFYDCVCQNVEEILGNKMAYKRFQMRAQIFLKMTCKNCNFWKIASFFGEFSDYQFKLLDDRHNNHLKAPSFIYPSVKTESFYLFSFRSYVGCEEVLKMALQGWFLNFSSMDLSHFEELTPHTLHSSYLYDIVSEKNIKKNTPTKNVKLTVE